MPVPASRSRMSRSRQGLRLIRYSPSPLRYTRRVMWTSGVSIGSRLVGVVEVSVISAEFMPRRLAEPLKITSAISLPRRLLTLCSPSTHLMASTMFDLPEPFGPTTTVIPWGNSNRVLSAKLLKPTSSSALSMGRMRLRFRVRIT